MRRRFSPRVTWATLAQVAVHNRAVRIAAARLGALILLAAAAVVPATTSVGPVLLILWSGSGLHALDVGLIAVGVPAAVALLRHAEVLREDEPPAQARIRHQLRRRRTSAKTATRGALNWTRSHPRVLAAAGIIGGIGFILALAASSRSTAVMGGTLMGGAITLVAACLSDVHASKHLEREAARLRQMVDEIMVARADSERLCFPQDGERETTRTEVRLRRGVEGRISGVADLSTGPGIPSTTMD